MDYDTILLPFTSTTIELNEKGLILYCSFSFLPTCFPCLSCVGIGMKYACNRKGRPWNCFIYEKYAHFVHGLGFDFVDGVGVCLDGLMTAIFVKYQLGLGLPFRFPLLGIWYALLDKCACSYACTHFCLLWSISLCLLLLSYHLFFNFQGKDYFSTRIFLTLY